MKNQNIDKNKPEDEILEKKRLKREEKLHREIDERLREKDQDPKQQEKNKGE